MCRQASSSDKVLASCTRYESRGSRSQIGAWYRLARSAQSQSWVYLNGVNAPTFSARAREKKKLEVPMAELPVKNQFAAGSSAQRARKVW